MCHLYALVKTVYLGLTLRAFVARLPFADSTLGSFSSSPEQFADDFVSVFFVVAIASSIRCWVGTFGWSFSV